MPTVYLNIGSNTGDRRAQIAQAVARVGMLDGVEGVRESEIVESEAWGYESANRYLNVGIAMESDKEPLTLLHSLQKIEREVGTSPHRNADGSYRDREIDIDIIAIDDMEIESEELTIPHPRMHERAFVLKPMTELAPEWKHPRLHLTCSQLLALIE